MFSTEAENLIAHLSRGLTSNDRESFRQAAESALASSPTCWGPGSVYRTLVPLWRQFFQAPPDDRGTTWSQEPKELRLINRRQDRHHRCLDDLVLQARDAERSLSAIRLRYVCPPRWQRPIRSSRLCPGHDRWGCQWRSPGSCTKGVCACQGLRRRGAGSCLALSSRAVLPSVGRKTSAPRTCLTPLNTSPAHSPVNASCIPSRLVRASLGVGAAR
jgi:hypothetical protein